MEHTTKNAEIVTNQEDLIVSQNENKLVPLSSATLEHYDSQTQTEILHLSKEIDVLQLEKVMSFGSIPLLRSIEQAGKILEDAQGTTADQKVIDEVIKLSKQANKSYSEVSLELKEPNRIEKLFSKIVSSVKGKNDKDVAIKALSCYKLLKQLTESCERWIEMLQDNFVSIHESSDLDRSTFEEIEKYIVAGRIAEERIENEVELARQAWETSGLMKDKDKYDELKSGLDTFRIVLLNLEKSRAANGLSVGQLNLTLEANKNTQIAVRTQRINTLQLTTQQLRNAVLSAKNKIALEGQKSLSGLNSELMKKISKDIVLTSKESEEVLLSGVYSIDAALEAVQTVISGCEAIEKAHNERNANVNKKLNELKVFLNEITPFVDTIKSTDSSSSSSSSTSTETNSGLKF